MLFDLKWTIRVPRGSEPEPKKWSLHLLALASERVIALSALLKEC